MWWSDQQGGFWLFELTVSYVSLVADARGRKRANEIVEAGRTATVEVEPREVLEESDFEGLKKAIHATQKDATNLSLQTISSAILGSFKIWSCRNSIT